MRETGSTAILKEDAACLPVMVAYLQQRLLIAQTIFEPYSRGMLAWLPIKHRNADRTTKSERGVAWHLPHLLPCRA